jgi:hypothetical protein
LRRGGQVEQEREANALLFRQVLALAGRELGEKLLLHLRVQGRIYLLQYFDSLEIDATGEEVLAHRMRVLDRSIVPQPGLARCRRGDGGLRVRVDGIGVGADGELGAE